MQWITIISFLIDSIWNVLLFVLLLTIDYQILFKYFIDLI